MTTIYTSKSKGYYLVAARQHADNPLVCAAISSAMCGLYNTVLSQKTIKEGECDGFSESSGSCTVRFSGGSEAEAVYQYFLDTIRLLETTYPDNVRILPYSGGEIYQV